MSRLKCAAIDVGSNAVRFLVADVYKTRKLVISPQAFLRLPIRLLSDFDFSARLISNATIDRLVQGLTALKLLLDTFVVTNYKAAATSALREASNSQKIIDRLAGEVGIDLKLLSAQEEALITVQAVVQKISLNAEALFHIDIGGGSTELTLWQNDRLLTSRSFAIGTVRMLEQAVAIAEWQKFKEFIKSCVVKYPNIKFSGSGGAIDIIYRLVSQSEGVLELASILALKNRWYEQAASELALEFRLSDDRSDVLPYALDILSCFMNQAFIKSILVPQVGLIDGLLGLAYDS